MVQTISRVGSRLVLHRITGLETVSTFSAAIADEYDMMAPVRLRKSSSSKSGLFNQPDFRSEKNLAVAILRQAWHEAILDLHSVKETSREDHRLLKRKAIDWINNDEEGFPYWCQLADVDHSALRRELDDAIGGQRVQKG